MVTGAAIARDLAGLIGRQRPDGGWAWCDDPGCSTDPNVSGWVLLALGEARRDGLCIDSVVLARGRGRVRRSRRIAAKRAATRSVRIPRRFEARRAR